MKHVTFAEKSLLMGDQAADTLIEYARLIAEANRADVVTLSSISADGNTVEASFLLNSHTVLMIGSTNSLVEPPENREAVQEIQDRIDAIRRPATAQTEERWPQAECDISDI